MEETPSPTPMRTAQSLRVINEEEQTEGETAEYQHKASAGRIDSLPAEDLPAAINRGFISVSGNLT